MSEINPKPDGGVSDSHLGMNGTAVSEKTEIGQSRNQNNRDGSEIVTKSQAPNVTGLAVVEQGHTIPTTGERKITTSLEYWAYCLYGKLGFVKRWFPRDRTGAHQYKF
jgi:hypothetical protein